MNRLLLASLLALGACERAFVDEAEFFEGARLVKPSGYALSPRGLDDFELLAETKGETIEKVNYVWFDAKTLALPLDSVATAAFADSLGKAYARALKRKMGVFGGAMKTYLDYFDKFQILSLDRLERDGIEWRAALKKHVDENHYWQTLFVAREGRVAFISLFYALNEGEPPIPTSALAKFVEVVRFSPQDSLARRASSSEPTKRP